MASREDTWVTVSSDDEEVIEQKKLRVEVIQGPDAKAAVEFASGRVRVGARSENELTLRDPQVSGLHLELAVEPMGVRVRDLGSTNGTFVGATRVVDAYVGPGARIRVGTTVLAIEAPGGAERVAIQRESRFGPLVGRSVGMRALFSRLGRIAKTDVPVLITGETGAGKEVVARAIHEKSPRAERPFVAVDCAALPASLIESELFGYEKGAFTGAERSFAGAFERAEDGTLFLDELGELPLAMQPKLLRAIDQLEVRRLGSDTVRPVRARILAATNRDLAAMIGQGAFRDDLYYRLAVAEVRLPPLRQRPEDIAVIAEHVLDELRARTGEALPALDAATVEALTRHRWPGNVRELKNAVTRIALLGEDPLESVPVRAEGRRDPVIPVDLERPYRESRDAVLATFQTLYTEEMLRRSGGSVMLAARRAGVDRMTFYRILKRPG